MKSLFIAIALMTSFSTFADVTCSGTQDGKAVEFVMTTDANGAYDSITANVDGSQFASFSGAQVKVSKHVYGTIIEGVTSPGSSTDRLMVLIARKIRGDETNEGWITFYGTLNVIGVDLDCNI